MTASAHTFPLPWRRFAASACSTVLAPILAAACSLALLLPGVAKAYVDPTTGNDTASRVTRAFDKPDKAWQPGHRGVDLAAKPGQPILAADDGVVSYVGTIAGVPVISIEHADGIKTTYQPAHARVNKGDEVHEGQTIGILGHPVDEYGGLHWGAKDGDGKNDYINPLDLLDAPTIRLKPVTG